MITTQCGNPVTPLGLAAHPEQAPACVARALTAGINLFFFYDTSHRTFVAALKPLLQGRRDEVLVASGSGARTAGGLRTARRRVLSAIGAEMIDVFFAEYVHPGDHTEAIFGEGGVLDELQRWKEDGLIRLAGASAHDRSLARQLAEDSRVDLLMHRYNMAHRRAALEVFPAALRAQTPVIAFTATRWSTLLEPHPDWTGPLPSAADCYRYCLTQPAVQLVLTAPRTVAELNANLRVLKSPGMSHREREQWEEFGDIVYAREREADPFESHWP